MTLLFLMSFVSFNLKGSEYFPNAPYISLAAELGLLVILHPGPYICAEWDLGVLRSFGWLFRDKNMKLRTTYSVFIEAEKPFLNKLIPIIKPLQFEEGGPIIAVQVENEYGLYAKDERYMPFMKETVNLQRLANGTIQYLAYMQPQKPLLLMEYWFGWFDVWSESHHVFPAEDMLAVVSQILEPGVSINLYMFHGGTSFGFMNGAVVNLGTYKPQVGSYSASFILECICVSQMRSFLRLPLSRPGEYVIIQKHLSLWESLQFTDKPLKSEGPVNIENNNNGQFYGYTQYETTISSRGLLNSKTNFRVTYHPVLGLVGDIVLNHVPLKGFTIYCLDMKPNFLKRLSATSQWNSVPQKPSFPGFFQGRLYVDGHPRDTFIPETQCFQPQGWSKGVVFINGQNLGRHRSVVPQQTLYLPGPWLKSGNNQIIVFEKHKDDYKFVFVENPDHGKTIDVYKHPFCVLL
ncbi:beta-galactosidase-1-like protein 2 [Salvelinus alpinus]